MYWSASLALKQFIPVDGTFSQKLLPFTKKVRLNNASAGFVVPQIYKRMTRKNDGELIVLRKRKFLLGSTNF